VDLIVSLIVVLAIILVKTRHNGFLKNAVAESEIAELPVLIVGVMFFSWSIKSTNAVQNLPTEFSGLGIPNEIILYVVPFVVGLLTGLTIAPVGITFPLLMPLINAGALNPGYFMLAYVGGFMGVMLSPVHLCLVLTAGYYRADLWKTYRTIIPLVAVVTFMAFAIAALAY